MDDHDSPEFWRRRAIGYSQMADNAERELQAMAWRALVQMVVSFVVGLVVGFLLLHK